MKRLGKALRELLHGRREGIARGDVQAHVADDDLEIDVLRLVLKRLEALHQREAGVEERGELLGEDREFAEGQLVALGLFLDGLLLGEDLGGLDVGPVRLPSRGPR